MTRSSENNSQSSPADSMRSTRRFRDILMPRRSPTSTLRKTLTKSESAAADLAAGSPSEQMMSQSRSEDTHLSSDEKTGLAMIEGSDSRPKTRVEATASDWNRELAYHEAVQEQKDIEYGHGASQGTKNDNYSSSLVPAQDDKTAQHAIDNGAPTMPGGQDALMTEDREPVESLVVEAIEQQSRKFSIRHPLKITITFKIQKRDNVPTHSAPKHIPANILEGPRRIGPLAISESNNTYNLQLSAIGIYAFIVLSAAFIGPRTLFFVLWKLSIALITYVAAEQVLGWQIDTHADIVLGPVAHATRLVHKVVCDVTGHFGIARISLDAQVVCESQEDADAVVNLEE